MLTKLKRWLKARYIVSAVLLLLFVISLISFFSVRGMLESQKAAVRFRGDNEQRFAQISCFLPAGEELDEMSIYSFRSTLDAKLVAASLEAEEGGSLYKDAYSSHGTVTASSNRGSFQLDAVGVGGDFFFFHPLRLRSGSYIDEEDLMHDRVVLDEEAAWKLFGAIDVAGMEFTMNGKPYIVAGVVKRETDSASKKVYESEGGIFLFADQMESPITNYELVLADAVSGFAEGIVKESFPVSDKLMVVNSERYEVGKLWKILTHFGERSVISGGYDLPYWENAARMTEDWLALCFLLCLLLPLFPAVLVIIYIVKQGRRLSAFLKKKWKQRI